MSHGGVIDLLSDGDVDSETENTSPSTSSTLVSQSPAPAAQRPVTQQPPQPRAMRVTIADAEKTFYDQYAEVCRWNYRRSHSDYEKSIIFMSIIQIGRLLLNTNIVCVK